MTDPVCHIPPITTINQPGPTALPAIPPPAPNVQSLLATVQALRQIILIITGQQGQQGQQGAAGKNAPSGSWKQAAPVTEVVRIFQNNDPSSGNWVDVQRINRQEFDNAASKQTLVFVRPPSSGQ